MDATWFSSSRGKHKRGPQQDVVEASQHHQLVGHGGDDIGISSLDTVLLTGSDWDALLQGVVNMCVSFDREQQEVAEDDVYYLLVTTRPMMQHGSSLLGDMDDDASVVNRIQIKYVETLYDVIRLGSVLPLVMRQGQQGSERHCVVILHGLDKIVDASHGISSSLANVSGAEGRNKQGRHGVESLLCRTMAIMKDAVENTRRKGLSILCATLWSESMDNPPRYYFFVSRWLKSMYGMYLSEKLGEEWYHTVSKIEFDETTHRPARVGPLAFIQRQRMNM